MAEISSYIAKEIEDTALIPISKIEIDRVMESTLGEYDASTENLILKTRGAIAPAPRLRRMDRMLEGFHDGVVLDPVILKIHKTGGGRKYVPPALRAKGVAPEEIPVVTTYSIVQGRHRVVASILYGYTHVPAIVQK